MTKEDGGPAFPVTLEIGQGAGTYSGMSLREWFAGMALQGYLSSLARFDVRSSCSEHVKLAYKYADTMLKERTK